MKGEVSWLIGGPQGSGVDTASNIFSRACAGAGCHVFGKREFYSNIKGEHSYFVVRASSRPVHSNASEADFMASYDAETVFRHADDVASGGAILYDSALEGSSTDDARALDKSYLERLLKKHNATGSITVSDVLESAKKRGVSVHPVAFRDILSGVAARHDNPKLGKMIRLFNTVGVSLSLAAMGVPYAALDAAVKDVFSSRKAILEINEQASKYAYEEGSKLGIKCAQIPESSLPPHTMLAQGYQGTAVGKMVCGCRMQPYYPITPASDESYFLETHQELAGGGSVFVVQCEDEICAIGMTIGAALTGCRAATCTSGPGFALMTEMLGWAGINEVPIVVTLYQRSGPSTGLPTRHGQDDLMCAVHAGHGEFPRIVYASGDTEESFYDTALCFNYAERYQLPVIHMMDKFLASSVSTCPRFDAGRISIDRGKLLSEAPPEYARFAPSDDGISPRSYLGLKGGIFWNTGDESDEEGHITEDPQVRIHMMDKRMSKYERILGELPEAEQASLYGSGKLAVLVWGSAKGPAMDAVEMLRERDGISARLVQPKLIWPFPAKTVSAMLEGAETIVDVEANHTAQLASLLRQETGIEPDHHILKYTGRAMTCTEVYDALRRIAKGSGQKREVLVHGA